MKKVCVLILCLSVTSLLLSACTSKQSATMVKAKSRFQQYVEPPKTQQKGVIDLSEGPKLKYDADFGPKNPNFDFKIKNPY